MQMVQLRAGDRNAQVRGILFDKDGTLLQFISLWGWWAEKVLHDLEQELKKRAAPCRSSLDIY